MPITEPRRLHWNGLSLDVRAQRRPYRKRILEPTADFLVELDTKVIARDPLDALVRVREALESPASLDDVPVVSMSLDSADRLLFWGDDASGSFTLAIKTETPSAFPYQSVPLATDAIDFAFAVKRAESVLGALWIHLERIEASERWWYFPTVSIGCLGALIDRRVKKPAVLLGSGLGGGLGATLWSYELGLLDEPARSIRVDRVHDLETAASAIACFTWHEPEEVAAALAELPAVFHGRQDLLGSADLWRARDAMAFEVLPRDPR